MKAIDMTKIYGDKRYKGKWVALKSYKERKVIAYGDTLNKILEESAKKGTTHPWVMQIPKKIVPLVGGFTIVK